MGVREDIPGEKYPPAKPGLATPLFALGGVLVLLFFFRAFVRTRHHRRLADIVQRNDQTQYVKAGSFGASVKKHVLYAPLWSMRHSHEFRLLGRFHMGTLPLRLEAMLVLGYIALNAAFILVFIDWWADLNQKLYQIKFAAGHIAVMNTPGLVLMAGRNNPLIPILGVSFDSFNFVHRWIGRTVAAEAVVHMGCVVGAMVREHGFGKVTDLVWHEPFLIYGLVSLIGFVVLVLLASSPIRHAFYESFLHLHILLAVMAFVPLWYHLQHLPQRHILFTTAMLWCFDRAGRIASLIWRNCGRRRTIATVEILSGSVARVDVAIARPWKFKPDQFMYLYIPALGLWTSHPFSVAWTSTDSADTNEKRSLHDSFNFPLGEPKHTTMSFLIKRRDGITNKILKKAEGSVHSKVDVTAFAEGPFGGLHSLASYGTVMLIAGGIGITHPMSFLYEFVHGFDTGTVATRKVRLVWVVRSLDNISWIQPWMSSILSHPVLQSDSHNQNLHFKFPGFFLSIQIYVTSQYATDDSVSDGLSWTQTAPPTVPVSINFGKPPFERIMDSEEAEQVGAMAVTVCGPGSLSDQVRRVVRYRQKETTVDFYEESFSW